MSATAPMMTAQPAARDLPGEFRKILDMIIRGWWMIGLSTLICMTLAVIYLAKARRQYQSTARLLVLQQGGRPLNMANTDPNRMMDGVEDYIPTHSLILSSPMVVQRAIDSVGLPNLPTLLESVEKDAPAVEGAIEHLKVTRPDKLAKILKVDYRANSPEEATLLLKAIVASYETFVDSTFQKNSNDVVALISKARDELGKELKTLEDKYQDLRRKSPVLMLDEAGRSFATRRLENWDRASNEAMIKSIGLKAQLDLGKNLAKDGAELWSIAHALGQIGGEPSSLNVALNSGSGMSATMDYIRRLTQEQQELSARLGPQYARVRELQAEIGRAHAQARGTRGQLERVDVDHLVHSIEMSLKSVESMKDELNKRFEQEKASSREDELILLAEATLRGDLDRQRALFNTVVDQLKQARFVGDYSSISAQTIEPPNAVQRPVKPVVSLVLVLALFAGLVSGVGAAFLADRLDTRLRSIAEVRDILGPTVLGQIALVRPGHAAASVEFGLVCHALPRSPWAESFRAVRTTLDFLRRRQGVQIVLISSAHPSDGKSSASSNIAISLAQAGRRVLLVDADLRKPRQHAIHGASKDIGLVQVLRDGLPMALATRNTAVDNLQILVAGPEVANPAELLASPRLTEFLDQARATYDMVIIDSPPMLVVTDSSIIGAAVDGIVLVVRDATLRRGEALRVREALDGMGSNLLGTILNGVDSTAEGYGSGYGSGYVYGSGSGSGSSRSTQVVSASDAAVASPEVRSIGELSPNVVVDGVNFSNGQGH